MEENFDNAATKARVSGAVDDSLHFIQLDIKG